MANSERGGSPEQHAKAGEQRHKNTSGSGSKETGSGGSTRGGSPEQHAKAGEQSHKNTSGSGSKESGSEGSTRGGSPEQQPRPANRAIKIADDFRGRFGGPLTTLGRRRSDTCGPLKICRKAGES
jgi:hypothetical protein